MAAKKKIESPKIEVKDFTLEEIDYGIHKLKKRIEEVNNLDPNKIPYNDARIENEQLNIRETIRDVFGPNSPEFNRYGHHEIWHGSIYMGMTDYECQHCFAQGIPQTVTILEGLLGRLKEKKEDLAFKVKNQVPSQKLPSGSTRRVFLVHGHDEGAKQTVARFLEHLDLQPIILHEQPSEGKTIIEKFEKNADVEFAVVLLTPDDLCSLKSHPKNMRPRARQNVILELGYFIGRLTRQRVCALCKNDIELPSDYHGVVYVSMDESEGWKLQLAKEIKQSGLDIDMNRVI